MYLMGVNMPSTAMVHVRVDGKIKEEASATLAKMGISISECRAHDARAGSGGHASEVACKMPASVNAMKSADKKQGKRFRSAEALFEDLGV